MGKYCSGNVGFCDFIDSTRALEVTWNNDAVESVDCDYQVCGNAEVCKLYNAAPIGFCPTRPLNNQN